MRKRIISILLALLMLPTLSLFGCANNKQRDRVELVEGSLPLGKYESKLNISVGQMVSATKYVSGETASENVVYDLYDELLNIKFNSQFSANIGEAYTYQLGMSMLSDELPDLFYCTQDELAELIDQEMVADLTDAYEKYASPALKLAVEYAYTGDINEWNNGSPNLKKDSGPLDVVSKDGRIYGFPFLSDLFEGCPLAWIRADWLKEYAKSKNITYNDISEVMPKDFAQYLEIIRFFANNDPDNNGKKDTYGLGLGFDGAGLQSISNVYGSYPNTYVKNENGEYEYGGQSNEFRDAMKLYNSLYREGVIDANSALDGQLLKQALASGSIGTFMGEYWHIMWGIGDSVINNPNSDWLPWAIRDYEGNVIKPMVPVNVLGKSCYAMSVKCPNPEVVFVLANHLVDAYFSNDGELTKRMIEIRKSEKYRPVRDEVGMYSPIRMDAPNKNIRYAFDIQKGLKTGDTSGMSIDCLEVFETVKSYVDDPRGVGKPYYSLFKVFGPTGAYNELLNYCDYDYEKDKNKLQVKFKRPAYSGMNNAAMTTYNSIIKEYNGVELVKFYTGDSQFTDAEWNKYVQGMNAKGMKAILDELNSNTRGL